MTTPGELRAFLARPRARLRALKERHNAAIIEHEGADAAFRMAASLHEHAEAMGARPSAEERASDLATAVRLRRLLDRASQRRQRPR